MEGKPRLSERQAARNGNFVAAEACAVINVSSSLPSRTMRIDEILGRPEPVFSIEFFPPTSPEKGDEPFQTVEALRPLDPSFVSVTYGAGGATRDGTVEIATRIKQAHGLEAMAHLSCVGETQEGLIETLDLSRDAAIENVPPLRGAPPRGEVEFQAPDGGLS